MDAVFVYWSFFSIFSDQVIEALLAEVGLHIARAHTFTTRPREQEFLNELRIKIYL